MEGAARHRYTEEQIRYVLSRWEDHQATLISDFATKFYVQLPFDKFKYVVNKYARREPWINEFGHLVREKKRGGGVTGQATTNAPGNLPPTNYAVPQLDRAPLAAPPLPQPPVISDTVGGLNTPLAGNTSMVNSSLVVSPAGKEADTIDANNHVGQQTGSPGSGTPVFKQKDTINVVAPVNQKDIASPETRQIAGPQQVRLSQQVQPAQPVQAVNTIQQVRQPQQPQQTQHQQTQHQQTQQPPSCPQISRPSQVVPPHEQPGALGDNSSQTTKEGLTPSSTSPPTNSATPQPGPNPQASFFLMYPSHFYFEYSMAPEFDLGEHSQKHLLDGFPNLPWTFNRGLGEPELAPPPNTIPHRYPVVVAVSAQSPSSSNLPQRQAQAEDEAMSAGNSEPVTKRPRIDGS